MEAKRNASKELFEFVLVFENSAMSCSFSWNAARATDQMYPYFGLCTPRLHYADLRKVKLFLLTRALYRL